MKTSVAGRVGIVAGLCCSAYAFGQCGWTGEEGVGTDGRVLAQVVWDPDGAGPQDPELIVGGAFAAAGALNVDGIAVWTGSHWSALASGLNGTVRSLVVYNGMLIAGGDFSSAGGQPAASIAAYDGSAWHALGAGLDGPAYALAVYNGDLYAAGVFTHAGAQQAVAIARWDGSAWHDVGGGMDGPVYALQVFNGSLYAGGTFATAGGNSAADIASWNGTAWSPLGSGVAYSGGTPFVHGLTVFNNELVVAGQFTMAGPLVANSVAGWDGSAWQPFGAGVSERNCPVCSFVPGLLNAAAVSGGTLYVAGDNLWRWTGSSWSLVSQTAQGFQTDVYDTLTDFGGHLYAAGLFLGGSSPVGYRYNILSWDGATQTPLTNGFDNGVHDVAEYNGGVIAVGEFRTVRAAPATGTAFYDGSSWGPLGQAPVSTVYSVAVQGGNAYIASNNAEYQWNGSTWSQMSSLGAAESLRVLGTDLYASGSLSIHGVFRWTGSAWVSLGTLTGANEPVLYNGQVTTSITQTGNVQSVSRWNGIAWIQVAPNFMGASPGPVAVYNGNLVSVWYLSSSAVVAMWDGSAWTQMGQAFNYGVAQAVGMKALAVSGGRLYIGGEFTSVGSTPANRAAVWDGMAWQPLGAGLGDRFPEHIRDIQGRATYAGTFKLVDNRRYFFLASWGCPSAPCYANCDGSTAVPFLNVNDFVCFQGRFAAGDSAANCDGSTTPPVLNVNDFICFQGRFAAGCSAP